MTQTGKVYLIGAGPGDPGLITVKGLHCLRAADVIVYDAAINPALLREARPDAELIVVDRNAVRGSLSEEVNRLLVERAAAGKVVVRLEKDDPFLFGSGSEEAEALAATGIPWEVVPGVIAAVAAPAYAGVPVTHRNFTATFAAIASEEQLMSMAWDKVASGDSTLVFSVAAGKVEQIAEQLLAHGCPSQTPIMVIYRGTTLQQQTISGVLADIGVHVRAAGIDAPAIAVIGDVVGLRSHLRWFDRRPLWGKRVLVTRAAEQALELCELLEQAGAEPIVLSTIRIEPAADYGPLDRALAHLEHYQWVIFTSVNGWRAVVTRLRDLGRDWRVFGNVKLAAIGPATAGALRASGFQVDLVPSEYVAEGILAAIGEVRGQRILLPRADIARETLAAELRRRGAVVDEVVAYRTVSEQTAPIQLRELLAAHRVDVITFTSSSTVRNFVAMLGDSVPTELLREIVVACIGPITAQTARQMGIMPTIVAQEYTMAGLTSAIVEYFAGRKN
jgi:uroporphyrinogen III methyltransferase/synthase